MIFPFGAAGAWLGPGALAVSRDGQTLYVAGERSREVVVVDLVGRRLLRRFRLEEAPSGLVLDEAAHKLIITCSGERNRVVFLDSANGRVVSSRPAGYGACSPALSAAGDKLYVCNRYEDTVSLIQPRKGTELARVRVAHEPVAAALAPDGRVVAVANLLPVGPANTLKVRGCVSLLEAGRLANRRDVWLPDGSTSVRGIAFHPSKNTCAVAHNIARFQVPATQVEYGWMNVSALSLVSAEEGKLRVSILLDEPRKGAANPSCVTWSPDGQYLCVGHAGTHELSIIGYTALEEKLVSVPKGALVDNFAFLDGLRTRVALPGKSPRAVVAHGQVAYVAEFFSDSVSAVDLSSHRVLFTISLGAAGGYDAGREGERLFNDATICHQGWQSCASCHPEGRADGLNWDLLNDGIGNPKNTKSLLLAHATPPAMSSGVRDSAEAAVRSGLRHILFAKVEEHEAAAIDEYLRSLRPVASPYLVKGRLSRAAFRGKRLFESPEVGCAVCHPGPLFTDLQSHAVYAPDGSSGGRGAIDTPTLVECWRTAPYLHDGSAVTVREVLTGKNAQDAHGRTSHLSRRQIADLAEYVLSL